MAEIICTRCKRPIEDCEEYVRAKGWGCILRYYCETCAYDEAAENMGLDDVAEILHGDVLTYHAPEKPSEDKPLPGQIDMFGGVVDA